MRIMLIVLLPVLLITSQPVGLAARPPLKDAIKEFSYEGRLDRIIAREFIIEARKRLTDAKPKMPPLSDRRIKEIILYTETAVLICNSKIKETEWYSGHPVSEQEVLEGIATANLFQNGSAQQEWETSPNLGYTDLRETTALNSLWDLEITTLYGHKVPQYEGEDGLDAYRRDKKFRKWFHDILISIPKTNILLGTWTLCKVKNRARGSFQKTVAFYTMGEKSYKRRLKKDPKSQGLAPVAWGHLKRWKDWHSVWNQVKKRIPYPVVPPKMAKGQPENS